jgi:hypothetical protein
LPRDSAGYFLRVTDEEKRKITQELERRVIQNRPYIFMINDCTINVVEILAMIGVIANDPRWLGAIASSPADLTRMLMRSERFARKFYYPGYDKSKAVE